MSHTDAAPNQAGRTGNYVQANDLHVYYEEAGSGRPLILLHGGAATSGMWGESLPALTPHFRVIMPDSRAHGRTNNPAGELSYCQMANDVAAFSRALDLTRPLVFGFSDGGQIALELGMNYPGLAQAIVVGGAYHKFAATDLSFFTAMGMEGPGAVNFAHFEATQPDWVDFLKTAHARDDDPTYWQTLIKQISVLWWTQLHYAIEDLQKMVDPTLILLGDRDDMTPIEQVVEMYRMLSNAELAILPNATHFSTLTPLSIQIVLDFLLRH